MIFFICAALLCALCVGYVWHGLLQTKQATPTSRRTAIMLAIVTPLAMLGLYMWKGSVGMPDFPIKSILSQAEIDTEKRLLQERPLIRSLRADPQNEVLWVELITLYVETNRPDQARQAYHDALQSVQKPSILKQISPAMFGAATN